MSPGRTISSDPWVSVVVPCLNRAHFLVPTLHSILQQDYPQIECIVVDGGSTDGTVDILKGYGTRIRWISEPDDGHAHAINKGWKMSRGEILAWLNADDCYIVPGAVREAVACFGKYPDADLIYGDYVETDRDGRVISDIIQPRSWDLASAVKYCRYVIPQPSSFMRRSILEKVHWLDPEFRNGKDHELWLRIGRIGTIKYVPVLFASARKCPGLTQDVSMAAAVVRLTEKFFNQPDLPPPFSQKPFRRRAMSNAYLTGGEHAWRGGHRTLFLRYLQKAVATDPLNGPYIAAKALRTLLAVSVPVGLKRSLLRLTGVTRRPDRRLNP
jgi:glycosyltransferase involved in cell wall biosynthesis